MAEQLLDLRQSLGALRRHRLALAGTVLLGAAIGVTLSSLQPSTYTSTSQVLLPQLASGGQLINRDPATESRVAASDAVLDRAGRALDPQRSGAAVRRLVTVSSPGDNVIQYVAHAPHAGVAKDVASAAAQAEVDYIEDGANAAVGQQMKDLDARLKTQQSHYDDYARVRQAATERMHNQTGADKIQSGNLITQLSDDMARVSADIEDIQTQKADLANDSQTAQVIQPATTATKPGPVRRGALFGLIGAGLAVVIAALLLVVVAGRDKRLRARDALADATGSPVLGAATSAAPRTVSGWSALLRGYQPGATDAWSLRQVLRQLLGPSDGESAAPARLGLLTLAGDTAGLAVAVQIASYAAATGLRVRLEAAGEVPSAALGAALRQAAGTEPRPGLEVGRTDTGLPDVTVTLAVLDRKHPAAPTGMGTVLLVVSAGSATADDLARAALAADDAGSRIDGILLADPDELDHTTGRLEPHERIAVTGPTRITGVSSYAFGATRGGHAR